MLLSCICQLIVNGDHDDVDFSFASYPASMVAGGSVIAAANGILGRSSIESFQLVTQLQRITSIDAVRCQCHAFCSVHPRRLCRSAWVGFSSLSVCLQHNSRTDDPKVFKLGIGNNLGMDILQVTWFWVKRSNVKVMVMVNSNTAWVWTRWVLSIFVHSLTEIQRSAGVLKTLVEQCLLILCTNPDFRL